METRYKVLEVLGKGTYGQVSIITLRWMRIIFVNDINCLEVNFMNSVRVVEVVGFGAVWICGLMQTFWRNMLSPFSGAEVTRQGNRWLVYDLKSKGWWKGAVIGREYGNRVWPLICDLTEHEKGNFLPFHTQPPTRNLSEGSLLVSIPFLSSLVLIGSLPSNLALHVLCKLSILPTNALRAIIPPLTVLFVVLDHFLGWYLQY
jgi:hypothetical protein